jgi:putative spermidine/putrescine transport system substrate-binding protein
VVGTTWQVIANLAQSEKAPVAVTLPKEGATGWSDTWMVSAKSKHKTCAYKFIDHMVSPQANADVAEYFGEAPANSKSCALTVAKDRCAILHANDEAYFSKVYYWNTPIQKVPRRPHERQVHRLRAVDQGLDLDPQQLSSRPRPRAGPRR